MTSDRTILITGVTGSQGGAGAAGYRVRHLRRLTRKPGSEPAAALARQRVDVVKGDLRAEATAPSTLSRMPPSGPGAARRRSHGKIVLRVAWRSRVQD